MKIKTSELTGAALDWAVLACLYPQQFETIQGFLRNWNLGAFHYSTEWSHGGLIIERENIEFILAKDGGHHESAKWMAVIRNSWFGFGEDHLTCAMRCYVISKLGAEVDIPEELV